MKFKNKGRIFVIIFNMIQTDKYIKYGTEMVIRLGSTDKFLCSLNFLST